MNSNSIRQVLGIFRNRNLTAYSFNQLRNYAAKKKQLTEAQIQFQKHTAELGFRERTTFKDTPFEYYDVETSIKYMQSEGKV